MARRKKAILLPERSDEEVIRSSGLTGKSETLATQLRRISYRSANEDYYGIILIVGEYGTGRARIANHLTRDQGKVLSIDCRCYSSDPFALLNNFCGGTSWSRPFPAFINSRPDPNSKRIPARVILENIEWLHISAQIDLRHILDGEGRSYLKIIATATPEIYKKMRDGSFDEGLYYSFGTKVDLPPLRDRPDDLDLLVPKLLNDIFTQNPDRRREWSPSATELLKRYNWGGNVMELENVLYQIVIRSPEGQVVDANYVLDYFKARSDRDKTDLSILQTLLKPRDIKTSPAKAQPVVGRRYRKPRVLAQDSSSKVPEPIAATGHSEAP